MAQPTVPVVTGSTTFTKFQLPHAAEFYTWAEAIQQAVHVTMAKSKPSIRKDHGMWVLSYWYEPVMLTTNMG